MDNQKNKFFDQYKKKDIIANKNQAISYCNNIPKECIVSNAISNLNIYVNTNFSKKTISLKMHDQRSIVFQFI